MAEYRWAKFLHQCNTVDTSGFCGPGGGFSGNRSSGKPLLLLRLKKPPPGAPKPPPGPPKPTKTKQNTKQKQNKNTV